MSSEPPAIDRQAAFSGTREVAPALAVDVGRLQTYLAAHLPGFAGPVTLRQFKGGQSNPTYLVETPQRVYVLRRKPPGRLLASAHAVDREFRVMRALFAQGFPVAEPLVYCGDEAIIGTAFYVMAHVDGRVIWEPAVPGVSIAERGAVFDAMNATIARLHAFDPAVIGLADFGRAQGYVARQVRRWSEQYRASSDEAIAEMDRLMAWLPDHVPDSPRAAVVHGDFRLDNLILAKDRPQVLAVIDWELATLGDPIADFVYHLMTWVMPPAPTGAGVGSLVGVDLAALGIPTLEDYAATYARRAGLTEIPHLDTYLAYNFFRLAAICRGIAGRVRDGTATSDSAALMATQVRPLAATAWRYAQKAGAR
ncbi:phosphotransferase family protein [Chelatococcus sp. SYSU_G07232]|uniref:Phosphotransferase family protein n=1 Tax=Chelatococcus albus TaxID=3047466 RepID=A0ABT7AGU7_9HYPH|nr:phosphotransferase family protein [Chelatococcus sp. SYSU_G07232]MDJ1157871.1 phosphotransferase family protein [Chelatococcus sp. SYSU_G07232]